MIRKPLSTMAHPRLHLDDTNRGFVEALIYMFTTRRPLWSAILHCPVCTGMALWRWLVRNKVSYKP
jgi:hypothetical protein